MAIEEDPAQVTELPVLPSANPSCASYVHPLGIAVDSEPDDHR